MKNPLLDATLPNTDYNRYTEIKDNLSIEWRVTSHFQVKGLAALTKNITKNDKYRSAESSEFDTQTDRIKAVTRSVIQPRLILMPISGSCITCLQTTYGDCNNFPLQLTWKVLLLFFEDKLKNIQYAQQFKGFKTTGSYTFKMVGFFANLNKVITVIS
ncbi:MAG: hypothetical protein ACLTZT_03885 [Butyricimonas faecalis]